MSTAISPRFLLGSCIALLITLPCEGWIPQASVSRYTHTAAAAAATTATMSSPTIGIGIGIGIGITMHRDVMRLDATSSPLNEYDDDLVSNTEDTDNAPPKPRIYRAAFSGVAVSPTGFWVMFQVGVDQYWPVQVTAVTETTGASKVTSPEALTLLQLLAGVDMAGAILPPDILARIIIGVCDNDTTKDSGGIADLVRRSSNWPDQTQAPVDAAYLDLPDWWQSRIRLPVCTLDEIHYQESESSDGSSGTWEYQCQVRDVGPQTVTPTCNVLQKVAWSDPATTVAADDEDSEDVTCNEQAAFFALALALRYKAPIRLSLAATDSSNSNSDALLLSHDQVLEQFPLYRSRDKLQETPATVTKNIERGFEYHKMQRALQIAIEKRDMAAAAKIRVRLDEMDSLEDLPVQAETDTQNMQ
jgi:hypothetical protein